MTMRASSAGRKPALGLPSQNDLTDLHIATLEILERVGLHVQSRPARVLLEGAGAKLKGDVAKLPPWLVKESLASAPPMIYLPGRTAHRDRILAPGRTGFACAAETSGILNLATGKVERADSESLAMAAKAIDALEVIGLALRPVVTLGNGPRSICDYETMVNVTAKHILLAPENGRSLKTILGMAKAAAGARRSNGLGHPVSFIAKIQSPLRLPEDVCDVILTGAALGAIICVMSSTVEGGSAPPNPAAALVVHNAEILAGVTLAQLARKGVKGIYASNSASLRPKDGMASAGAPEPASMGAAAASLASWYQLPSLIAGGRADSKLPDAQAGHEKTLTALLPALAGANVVHGLGSLEGGATLSLEQLLMDADFASMILFALGGLAIGDRTLSLDLIDDSDHHGVPRQASLSGRFIPSASKLIDRRAREPWLMDGGGMDMYQRAKTSLEELMKSRKGEPLTDAAREAVRRASQEAPG